MGTVVRSCLSSGRCIDRSCWEVVVVGDFFRKIGFAGTSDGNNSPCVGSAVLETYSLLTNILRRAEKWFWTMGVENISKLKP